MFGLIATVMYVLACVGIGLKLQDVIVGRDLPSSFSSALPHIASALVVGQSVLAMAWMCLGLLGWFYPIVIWGTLSVGIAIGISCAYTELKRAILEVQLIRVWLFQQGGGIVFLSAVLMLLVLGFGVAAWIAPPVGDAEAFYMTYARIIAALGRLEPMPGVYASFSSIGMVGEFHYAALIAIAGPAFAKLFTWFLALAAAQILIAIGVVGGVGRIGGLITLIMLFTTSAFTYHIWDGKVDLFAASLGLASVWWTLLAREDVSKLGAYVLGGACAGLAAVAKFSYVVAFLPAISILLFWPRSTGVGTNAMSQIDGRKIYFTNLLAFAGASFLAVMPHLIKNFVLFGAPLAPFIGGGDGQGWTNQTWFDGGVTRQIIFTYPLALVFGRYPMQGGNVSFLLLAFFPIWMLFHINGERLSTYLRNLFLASVVGVLIWVCLRPSIIAPRYLLATLLIIYPIVAKFVESLWLGKNASTWVRRCVILVSFFAMVIFAYPILPAVREAVLRTGDNSDDRMCALASVYCAPLQKLNAEASNGQRVYYAGYYTYWLKDELLLSKDTSSERSIIENSGSEHLLKLRQLGFAWLVVEKKAAGKTFGEIVLQNSPARNGYSVMYEDDEVVILRVENSVRIEST